MLSSGLQSNMKYISFSDHLVAGWMAGDSWLDGWVHF